MLGINFILAVFFMAVSGYLDGQWFNRVPTLWNKQITELHFNNLLIIVVTWTVANFAYLAGAFFLTRSGTGNPIIVTLVWFVAAIISLALIGGNFFSLSVFDKLIAIAALVLVGLLYFRGVAS